MIYINPTAPEIFSKKNLIKNIYIYIFKLTNIIYKILFILFDVFYLFDLVFEWFNQSN